jgi:hypothetical protein
MRAGGTLVGLAAAAALVAGCGGSGSSGSGSSGSGSSGSGSPGSGKTVSLSRAADVSSTASGYRLAMNMQEKVPNAGQINMTATGSFSPAAHLGDVTMRMDLPASAGTGTLQLGMVLDKTMMYMKLPASLTSKIPGGKPWLYINLAQIGQAAGIPGLGSLISSSSSLNDPGQYLDYLRATSAGSVKNLGQATVNGVHTTEYHAVVDMTKLPNAVPAAERKAVQQLVNTLKSKGLATQMPINAWIDSSNLIRRITLAFSEPVPSTGQTVSIAMTENFLQYGPQPVPAVPSQSESTNLLSLMHGSASPSASPSSSS